MSTTPGSGGGPPPPTPTTVVAPTTVAPPTPPTLGNRIWKVSIFVLGTLFGWFTDDLVKKPVVEWTEAAAQKIVPWDNPWVQWILPNTITFEATKISGCSGGDLRRLVTQAKAQGLNFSDEEQVADVRLCDHWTYHASARSVLEHMATKFDKCFSLDQTHSFSIKFQENVVCKTDYVLNPANNDWVKVPGKATLLCLSQPVNTPMSQSDPVAHECPDGELKTLGFTR
jgi:hypothetical protein